MLLLVGFGVFWPFIFGDGILLYRDIGSDSLKSCYSDFVHLSNYIRSDGFPSWSFHIGMGQDMAYATGLLFWEPVTWLPARFIAGALVYQHLLKIMIAGVLFFRFLRLRGSPAPVAILGALLIALSSYMTLGSCWYLPAEELLAFTAILLGAESAILRGRWLLLVLSIASVGMINPFYLYLCALLLCCYVPARLIAQAGWKPGLILKRSLLLAAISLLGVALGMAVTLPYLHVVLNSPRGSGATNSIALFASSPLFRLESAAHYITALLRPFANDLLGAGDSFRGWQNYFEAPQTYCGLISLLLLPQILLGGTRRHRILVILFLLWLILPTVFPWLRYLFWLFKGDYYRTYSLFCVFGIVVLSMSVLRRYLERGTFSLGLLVLWAAFLTGLLYLPLGALQNVIDPRLRIAVTLCLFLYTVILVVGELTKKQMLAVYLVLAVTAVELVYFNRVTVGDRQFVRKSELTNGLAANPDTIAALADLKRDDNSFFRMTRLYAGDGGAETDPNDAMLLGYYGTSSYGSFNDSNYIRFLAGLEALPTNQETDTRWAVGLAGNFMPSLFAAERYALVENPEPFQKAAQYELIRMYGNSSLFRNAFSLPLGLTFDRYLPEKEFFQLPRDGKEQVILGAAILDSNTAETVAGIKAITVSELEKDLAASSVPAIVEQRRATALKLASFAQNKIEGDLRVDRDSLLVLQTPFNPGWHAFQDGQPVSVVRADVGLLALPVKAGEHRVELRYRNPWLITGGVITGVAALLLAILLWRKPRLAVSLA